MATRIGVCFSRILRDTQQKNKVSVRERFKGIEPSTAAVSPCLNKRELLASRGHQIGIGAAEAMAQAVRKLGFDRLTEPMRESVERYLGELISANVVSNRSGVLHLVV